MKGLLFLFFVVLVPGAYAAEVLNKFLDDASSSEQLLSTCKDVGKNVIEKYNAYVPAASLVKIPISFEAWLELLVDAFYLYGCCSSYLDVYQKLNKKGLAQNLVWQELYNNNGKKIDRYKNSMHKAFGRLLALGARENFIVPQEKVDACILKPYRTAVKKFLLEIEALLKERKDGFFVSDLALLHRINQRCDFLYQLDVVFSDCLSSYFPGLVVKKPLTFRFFGDFESLDQRLSSLASLIKKFLVLDKMLRVAVASESTQKMGATLEAFTQLKDKGRFQFLRDKECFVVGLGCESGVSSNPTSEEETYQGALNRAEKIKTQDKDGEYDFYVGVESGTSFFGNDVLAFAWAVILAKSSTVVGKGRSGSFVLPSKLASALQSCVKDLNALSSPLPAEENVGGKSGTIGALSAGAITRKSNMKEALLMAILPHAHPELYKNG